MLIPKQPHYRPPAVKTLDKKPLVVPDELWLGLWRRSGLMSALVVLVGFANISLQGVGSSGAGKATTLSDWGSLATSYAVIAVLI
jgi:hypothetical protein